MVKKHLTIVEKTDDSSIQPLRELVKQALEHYLAQLDQHMPPCNVYRLVLEETEIPLLEAVLNYTAGNQCQAAKILGINRTTLRKKLHYYNLDRNLAYVNKPSH